MFHLNKQEKKSSRKPTVARKSNDKRRKELGK